MNSDSIFGAIDIGSNAIRLLINVIDATLGKPQAKKLAYLRVPIRLGEDVFTRGKVGYHKGERLVEAMHGFSHLMKAYEVRTFRACATSAMRDAENCHEIVAAIKGQTGIDVEIIDGKTEADLIYEAGAFKTLLTDRKNCLYVDVGGGSTEVVVYTSKKKAGSFSFQIGTVRLLSSAVQEEAFIQFQTTLEDISTHYAPTTIIASGGNINKVHKLLFKKKGEPIAVEELALLYQTLNAMSIESRMLTFDLNAYRADVIVPALQIFMNILEQCPTITTIYVPKVGLADGLIHHLYMNEVMQRAVLNT